MDNIQLYLDEVGKVFLFLGESKHKIKKKAEQTACFNSIQVLEKFAMQNYYRWLLNHS